MPMVKAVYIMMEVPVHRILQSGLNLLAQAGMIMGTRLRKPQRETLLLQVKVEEYPPFLW